jgi:hypothetical protein
MKTIASAHTTSSARSAAFFERWADVATWPEWNRDTEWVRLNGPFVTGATGSLKPKGGPTVKFLVSRLTDTEFVDVSTLLGARLTFHHVVQSNSDGGCSVDVTVTMSGPLAVIWKRILGKGLAASVQPDLDALARAAEAAEGARR